MTRLSLVMIARDEAHRISRALKSAAPHVDRMLVLDTGSVDGTVSLAESLGAEVHHFTWIDDFSAARNRALELADADWNLVIDADEWLKSGFEVLAALGEPDFIGHVQVESELQEDQPDSVSRYWAPRLLPRGVRYQGRIHEQPVGPLPQRRVDILFGHDGYLQESLDRKGARNESLLLLELEAAPQDPYLWYQLGREYQVGYKVQQAALCFKEALRLCPPDAPFRHGLVVRAITGLKSAGEIDEAANLIATEIDRWSESPDFFFAAGDLYLEMAQYRPEQAVSDFLPLAEASWKRCLEIGERPDLDASVAGRGSHMAAFNLSVLYETFGQPTLAEDYRTLAEDLRVKLSVTP